MDTIKASIDKYIEAVYHLLNAAAVMGLNEYQDLREVVQKYYSNATSNLKIVNQADNQNTAILDMLTEQEQLEEHMNQRRRQYQAEHQTITEQQTDKSPTGGIFGLITKQSTITERQTDLNDVIKEAEARNAELQYLNQTPPNTPNPEEQINTVVESNSSTQSCQNESISAVEDNPVPQRKEPPTINALFRLTPRQRDELCYQLFMTAKKNVTRLCPENTPQEEIDRLVKNEADRLLDVYIKTH